jgi:hypothetical protein
MLAMIERMATVIALVLLSLLRLTSIQGSELPSFM